MEFPQRKQPRLRDYDYSRAGAYFLTLCAKDKACIFSQVEAGAAVGRGVPDAPLFTPAAHGDASPVGRGIPDAPLFTPATHGDVSPVWRGIPDAPHIRLFQYGRSVEEAIRFLDDRSDALSVDKFVIMPNHIHLLVAIECEDGGALGMLRPTVNAVIPKFVSSLKRFTNKKCGIELWQNGYYDHIIRDQADYLIRWQYIEDNPFKWAEDEYNIFPAFASIP